VLVLFLVRLGEQPILNNLYSSSLKGKCLPILLYSLETCPLKKTSLRSLDFVIDHLFMKLFRTNNTDTVSVSNFENFEFFPVSQF